MLDPFSLPFFQRGILEVLLLAVVAGTLGTWIVLRGMAFFAHAVGTAMFPGLVLADGLGFAAALGAFGAALATAGFVAVAIRRRQVGADSLTALVLAGSLATGVILASDVFASQARVDRLLFGSLLAIDGPDLALAAGVAAAAAAASLLAGPRWLAAGFAGEAGHGGGRGADAVVVVLVALAAVAALRGHRRAPRHRDPRRPGGDRPPGHGADAPLAVAWWPPRSPPPRGCWGCGWPSS